MAGRADGGDGGGDASDASDASDATGSGSASEWRAWESASARYAKAHVAYSTHALTAAHAARKRRSAETDEALRGYFEELRARAGDPDGPIQRAARLSERLSQEVPRIELEGVGDLLEGKPRAWGTLTKVGVAPTRGRLAGLLLGDPEGMRRARRAASGELEASAAADLDPVLEFLA